MSLQSRILKNHFLAYLAHDASKASFVTFSSFNTSSYPQIYSYHLSATYTDLRKDYLSVVNAVKQMEVAIRDWPLSKFLLLLSSPTLVASLNDPTNATPWLWKSCVADSWPTDADDWKAEATAELAALRAMPLASNCLTIAEIPYVANRAVSYLLLRPGGSWLSAAGIPKNKGAPQGVGSLDSYGEIIADIDATTGLPVLL